MVDKGKNQEQKTEVKKRKSIVKSHTLYEIKGDRLTRKNKFCPKCGQGIFLAKHGNRLTCGKCGYSEFLKKEKK